MEESKIKMLTVPTGCIVHITRATRDDLDSYVQSWSMLLAAYTTIPMIFAVVVPCSTENKETTYWNFVAQACHDLS